MKIAFFWTGDFSKNILNWILKYPNINVELVVSQPDKEVWRKRIVEKTPIKIFAEEKNINVFQPIKLKDNIIFFDELKKLDLDFIIVVSYWKIIPKEILKIPRYMCVNLHPSLLPKYRWATPIQAALKNWDKLTGLTIIELNEWMDEWNILEVAKIEVYNRDKTPDIFKKVEEIWPKLLLETLNWIADWKIKWKSQDNSKATYCSKIEKQDGEISFTNETAFEIYNKFRAYYIWPKIFTFYKEKKLIIEECVPLSQAFPPREKGKIIKTENWEIWIICKEWILILQKIKLEWKKEMSIKDFVNGNKEFLEYKF